MTDSIRTVVIYGAGLAGQMTALALSHNLPSCYKICLINDKAINSEYDVLYGSLCSPSSYDFHLLLGLSEPDLMFNSDAVFSYGTHYQQWGRSQRDWVQCFHLPLPVQESVQFHQSMLRAGIQNLEPYLVSAQAARRGVFAHPPQDPKIPLSRAEYGYQVSSDKYLEVLSSIINNATSEKIVQIETDSVTVCAGEQCIESIHLNNGDRVEADWFIDCSGPNASLLSKLSTKFISKRQVSFASSNINDADIDADIKNKSTRTITAYGFGWQSETTLRGKVSKLTFFSEGDENAALKKHGKYDFLDNVQLGSFEQAWSKNCVAIGQAASMIEPLTLAPMILLQRDIERLLELIPLSEDNTIERKEFNRRFALDYEHACLFNDAFYQCDDHPDVLFWQQAQGLTVSEKLQIKLTQFESRAMISMFDLEPFNEEDWLILHFGMQRKPARYSRFAERHSNDQLLNWFASIERDISAIVNKMPPSVRYVSKMLDYLKAQP